MAVCGQRSCLFSKHINTKEKLSAKEVSRDHFYSLYSLYFTEMSAATIKTVQILFHSGDTIGQFPQSNNVELQDMLHLKSGALCHRLWLWIFNFIQISGSVLT